MSDSNNKAAREFEYVAEGVRLTLLSGVSPLYGKDVERFHAHSWFELFSPLSAPLTVHTEGKTCVLQPGQAILVPPGKVHYVEFSSDADRHDAFSFFMQELQQGEMSQSLRTLCESRDILLLQTNDGSKNLVQSCTAAMEEEKRVMAGSLFLALLLQYAAGLGGEQGSRAMFGDGAEGRIYKIEQALFSNFTGSLSLKKLAEELNLSQRQVSRIISRHYGANYRKKNKHLRMESAARRLREGESVSSVSAAAGYRSLSAFYAAFRSTFGMTPAEYKKMQEGDA